MIRANPMGAATVVIAIAALAAAVLAAATPVDPEVSPPAPQADQTAPLAACRALGETAGARPECQAAWAEARRRFFGMRDLEPTSQGAGR